MSGLGAELAMNEPAYVRFQRRAGGDWTGKVTVTALEKAPESDYAEHQADPAAVTVYYLRFAVDLLELNAPEGTAVSLSPQMLHPAVGPENKTQFFIKSAGPCVVDDGALKKRGDRHAQSCYVFTVAGPDVDKVALRPDGQMPFVTWTAR